MTEIIIVICLISFLVVLSKYNESAKDIIQEIRKEWIKARTVYTSAFYGAFLYLILNNIPVPPALNTIISTLFGYWFGQRQAKKEGGNGNA